tara:strand:+ start:42 stop:1073 length:1032 start_codon:yes stop_codon:yes gene_type:complete
MNDFWKNKNVLITGHTGFKGSWLSFILHHLGSKIHGLSKAEKKGVYEDVKLANLFTTEEFLDISKENKKIKDYIDSIKPQIVFHFAAQSLVPYAFKEPRETLETNIIGMFNILDSCNQNNDIQTLVISTTDKVYKNSSEWNKEDAALGGNEFYSLSKVSSEGVIQNFKDLYSRDNLNIGVVRSGNVIGGGDRGENRILTDVLSAILNEKKLILRNPDGIRPWQDVRDSIKGYLDIAEFTYLKKTSEIFNLNSKPNNKYNVKTLVQKYIDTWESNVEVEILKDNALVESSELRLDSTKAMSTLSWAPRISIDKSIENIVSWEKNNLENNAINEMKKQVEDYFNS